MENKKWLIFALLAFFLIGGNAYLAGRYTKSQRELEEAEKTIKVVCADRDSAANRANQWEKQYRESLIEIAELKAENEHLTAQNEELTREVEETSFALDEVCYETGWTQLGTFRVTHYCNCAKCCGKWAGGPTASGTTPTEGRTIAVDPNVIPIGSKVLINGHEYIAEDTGVSGASIDIFVNDHQKALQLGLYYSDVKLKTA